MHIFLHVLIKVYCCSQGHWRWQLTQTAYNCQICTCWNLLPESHYFTFFLQNHWIYWKRAEGENIFLCKDSISNLDLFVIFLSDNPFVLCKVSYRITAWLSSVRLVLLVNFLQASSQCKSTHYTGHVFPEIYQSGCVSAQPCQPSSAVELKPTSGDFWRRWVRVYDAQLHMHTCNIWLTNYSTSYTVTC